MSPPEWSPTQELSPLTDPVPDLLRDGELVVEGRLVAATNATLLCRLMPIGANQEAGVIHPMR